MQVGYNCVGFFTLYTMRNLYHPPPPQQKKKETKNNEMGVDRLDGPIPPPPLYFAVSNTHRGLT